MPTMLLDTARKNMIEQQIRTWDVLDERVLEVYRAGAIKREGFVQPQHAPLAYADLSLPIAEGQQMLEPKLEARLLQELTLTGDEQILHIGGGSGFFAALLGQMAKSVISVEIRPNIAQLAMDNVAKNNCDNVTVTVADGLNGLEDNGVYDAVVLTGSVPAVSANLFNRLSVGGKLLAVVGAPPVMTLKVHTKLNNETIVEKDILETQLQQLDNADNLDVFEF